MSYHSESEIRREHEQEQGTSYLYVPSRSFTQLQNALDTAYEARNAAWRALIHAAGPTHTRDEKEAVAAAYDVATSRYHQLFKEFEEAARLSGFRTVSVVEMMEDEA